MEEMIQLVQKLNHGEKEWLKEYLARDDASGERNPNPIGANRVTFAQSSAIMPGAPATPSFGGWSPVPTYPMTPNPSELELPSPSYSGAPTLPASVIPSNPFTPVPPASGVSSNPFTPNPYVPAYSVSHTTPPPVSPFNPFIPASPVVPGISEPSGTPILPTPVSTPIALNPPMPGSFSYPVYPTPQVPSVVPSNLSNPVSPNTYPVHPNPPVPESLPCPVNPNPHEPVSTLYLGDSNPPVPKTRPYPVKPVPLGFPEAPVHQETSIPQVVSEVTEPPVTIISPTTVSPPITPTSLAPPTSVPLRSQPASTVTKSKTMSDSQKALFKARDIELLKLKDLYELDGDSGKRFFIKQVRKLGGNEVDQVQLALSRMDRELRLFVSSRLDDEPIQTLTTVERILEEEFSGPKSQADAMLQLFGRSYNLEKNPRQFAHEFKIRYEAICTAYPETPRPDRVEIFKDVCMDGLPTDIKRYMRCYMSRGWDENQFIDALERVRLNQQMTVSVCQTGVKPNEVPSAPPANQNNPEPKYRARFPNFPLTPIRNQRPEYTYRCRYCDNGQKHGSRECPRRPRPGACFDCLDIGHRQGSPRCPGRDSSTSQSVPTRPTQDQE